ncbi:MAG: hypothetical protein UD286_06140 [Bacteroidales bacterium]|nr:hypothetical protein [Bacteroidales bacterium]
MRKKLLFLATVAIAALASCSKTEIRPEVESHDVHFVVNTAENEEVKSFIENNLNGSYTPKWSNEDELAIFVGTINENTKTPTGVLKNTNTTGTKASFGGVVSGISLEGKFKSFAPAAVFEKGYADRTIGINLASTQKPSKLTIDESCDILVAKEADYLADEKGNVVVDGLYFKRMFSVVKVALNGPATLNGEKVQKFSLTAPEGTVLAGRAAIDLSTATIKQWNIENNAVTAIYEADAPVFGGEAGLENVVWLVVNPCTIASDAKVVLAGETAGYTFSKEVTLPKDLVFPQSQLAVINLTLDETNFTEKQTETRIYVENFSMVTTNKTTPQPSATGAIGTGVSESLTYVYSGNNTNIRVNNNGHSSNDPYLYIPQNESFVINNLVVNEETSLVLSAQVKTNSGTSKVKVSYKESSTGVWSVASVELNATTSSFNTVQKVFFNIDSSVKSLDLKFESTNATLVDDIVLNRFEDTRVKLDVPANLSANVDEAVSNKINLTWNAVSNAKSYEVVLGAEGKTDIVKTAEGASLSVEGLEYSTLYSVKVKAISADVEKYIDSDYCAAVSVTTGVKPEGGSTTPVLLYTLTSVNGTNNSYAKNCDVTVDGITWNLTGNSQTNPWRLGGKSITKVDRALYSKTAYPKALTSIKVTFGKATITVNSCKLVYSTNADFTDSKECNIAFKASSTVEVIENFPADAYYKLVLNVTNSTNNNKFVELSKIEFFGLDN